MRTAKDIPVKKLYVPTFDEFVKNRLKISVTPQNWIINNGAIDNNNCNLVLQGTENSAWYIMPPTHYAIGMAISESYAFIEVHTDKEYPDCQITHWFDCPEKDLQKSYQNLSYWLKNQNINDFRLSENYIFENIYKQKIFGYEKQFNSFRDFLEHLKKHK